MVLLTLLLATTPSLAQDIYGILDDLLEYDDAEKELADAIAWGDACVSTTDSEISEEYFFRCFLGAYSNAADCPACDVFSGLVSCAHMQTPMPFANFLPRDLGLVGHGTDNFAQALFEWLFLLVTDGPTASVKRSFGGMEGYLAQHYERLAGHKEDRIDAIPRFQQTPRMSQLPADIQDSIAKEARDRGVFLPTLFEQERLQELVADLPEDIETELGPAGHPVPTAAGMKQLIGIVEQEQAELEAAADDDEAAQGNKKRQMGALIAGVLNYLSVQGMFSIRVPNRNPTHGDKALHDSADFYDYAMEESDLIDLLHPLRDAGHRKGLLHLPLRCDDGDCATVLKDTVGDQRMVLEPMARDIKRQLPKGLDISIDYRIYNRPSGGLTWEEIASRNAPWIPFRRAMITLHNTGDKDLVVPSVQYESLDFFSLNERALVQGLDKKRNHFGDNNVAGESPFEVGIGGDGAFLLGETDVTDDIGLDLVEHVTHTVYSARCAEPPKVEVFSSNKLVGATGDRFFDKMACSLRVGVPGGFEYANVRREYLDLHEVVAFVYASQTNDLLSPNYQRISYENVEVPAHSKVRIAVLIPELLEELDSAIDTPELYQTALARYHEYLEANQMYDKRWFNDLTREEAESVINFACAKDRPEVPREPIDTMYASD